MSKTEQTIKDNIILNLSNKIQEFSFEFRKNQKEFTEKLQKMGNKLSVIDDEDTSLKDFDKKYSDKFFYTKVETNSQILARNKSIDSLLESINELSNIFKDLQTVVQEQGTILDRIDYNLEIAEENTKSAYGHLNEANNLQKKSCFRNVRIMAYSRKQSCLTYYTSLNSMNYFLLSSLIVSRCHFFIFIVIEDKIPVYNSEESIMICIIPVCVKIFS